MEFRGKVYSEVKEAFLLSPELRGKHSDGPGRSQITLDQTGRPLNMWEWTGPFDWVPEWPDQLITWPINDISLSIDRWQPETG